MFAICTFLWQAPLGDLNLCIGHMCVFDSVFEIGFLMIYFVVLEFYSCVRYMHSHILQYHIIFWNMCMQKINVILIIFFNMVSHNFV